MWKKKRVIIIGILTAIVLAAVIGGVALAQEGTVTQPKTLLARVAEILGIDQQKVEDAFKQAQGEMKLDALKNRLQALVEAGKITQEQADQYLAWHQAQPNLSAYEQQLKDWMQARPTLPEEFKNWQQARPDVPFQMKPQGGGFPRIRGGMHRFPGGGGLPALPQGTVTQ